MRNVVVANPRAAGGKLRRWWRRQRTHIEAALGPLEVQYTERAGHGVSLTRQALERGCERVIAVGGDGTINEVVNGFFGPEGPMDPDAVMAVVPSGTGGDFVRSMGLAGVDPAEALSRATVRAMDVGRASFVTAAGEPVTRYFANISSLGGSGVVVDRVNRSSKLLGGKVSFYVGTVRGLLAYRNQRVRIQLDDEPAIERVINTVAVANGRYFGGSMKVAPRALVDDGMLDVVLLGDVSATEFLRYSSILYRGEHLNEWWADMLRGKRIEVTPLGDVPVLIDLDGEQPGQLPVLYEVEPKSLRFLAPWDAAEAASRP